MASKLPFHGNHHGLKFFRAEGWLREPLEKLCRTGGVRFVPGTGGSSGGEDAYYILEFGGSLNAKRLLEMGELIRSPYDPMPELSDVDYIRRLNY